MDNNRDDLSEEERLARLDELGKEMGENDVLANRALECMSGSTNAQLVVRCVDTLMHAHEIRREICKKRRSLRTEEEQADLDKRSAITDEKERTRLEQKYQGRFKGYKNE